LCPDLLWCFCLAPGVDDGFCLEPRLEGLGAVVVVVELVELEVEVVVVVVVVDVVVVAGQTCWIARIFNSGGTNDEIAVPTGTLNTSPPSTVTRKTHPESEAPTAGDHSPNPTTVRPAETSPTRCFRLLSTVVFLLPPNRVLIAADRDHLAVWRGRYWLRIGFATPNCSYAA
jgi:hypothetical protein